MAKQIYSYPDLSNSIVLVTGANGGIGFDIVNSALQAGAKVLATDLVIGASLEKLNFRPTAKTEKDYAFHVKKLMIQTV